MNVVPAVAVFAHAGGWDETLFVLAPLVIFAALLALARRRIGEEDAAAARLADPEPDPSAPRDEGEASTD